MGYTPDKKAQKKKMASGSGTLDGVKSQWQQKKPVLFFVLGFAVLMVLFYVILLSDYFQKNIQVKIIAVDASISSFFLNIFGMNTKTSREMILSPEFSISIARGCDALEAMGLFASALLSFPARWKHKLIGFFVGIAILFTLNIGRIISLYLTGVHFPKTFEFMHVEVWQGIFILFALGLWIFWIRWSRKEAARA